MTAVFFLSLGDYADVDDDVIQRESDLYQLTDDVMCVALPTRPARACAVVHLTLSLSLSQYLMFILHRFQNIDTCLSST